VVHLEVTVQLSFLGLLDATGLFLLLCIYSGLEEMSSRLISWLISWSWKQSES
jgi:hypothetical protein